MTLYFDANEIALENGETVLDGLLRAGHEMAFGCRAGVCQSCLMISESPVPAIAQQGLTDSQKKLGYFLSCSWKPEENVNIRRADATVNRVRTRLIEKTFYGDSVVVLRFEKNINYFSGQYMTLWRDEKIARSYSLASVPELDNYLEFHIKRISNGQFSSWVFDQLQVGDSLEIQGPMGKCIYSAVDKNQPLLLVGVGTGLAPLYGILRDALQQGHQGLINLVVAARTSSQFYLCEELKMLAQKYSNITVNFVAQEVTDLHLADSQTTQGDVYQFIQSHYPQLKGVKVYLCGAESFVRKLKKQCFLQGAAMGEISADAFLPCSR